MGCLISGAVGTIVCTSCWDEVGLAWLQEPWAASRLLVAQAEGPEAGARAYPQPPHCLTRPQPGGLQLAFLALLASPCQLPLLLPQLPPPSQLPPLMPQLPPPSQLPPLMPQLPPQPPPERPPGASANI